MTRKSDNRTNILGQSKRLLAGLLRFIGKTYYFCLRPLFITCASFSFQRNSPVACPVCTELSDKRPLLQARSNNPLLYDDRAWAKPLYELNGTSKIKVLHRIIGGEKDNASKFARLNYYECKNCESLFKVGAQFWKLNFTIRPDYYFNGYRSGQIFGRPILKHSPRINHWSRYISGFYGDTNSMKILDMGCAEGYLVLALQDLGFNAFGIEPNPAMCNYATLVLGINQENIKQSIYEVKSFDAETFDAISSYHTIEHCPSPHSILVNAFTHLKKGGLLFLSTPSAEASINELKSSGRNLNFVDSHDFLLSHGAIESIASSIGFEMIGKHDFDNEMAVFGIDLQGEKEGGMNYVFKKP